MSRAAEHPPGGLLLLQPAFLGDVVLSTALIEGWHAAYPDSPIQVWVRKGAHGFFEDHPFVSQVWVWDRAGWGKYPRMWSMARQVRRTRPGVVANLHRHASMGLVARWVGAPNHAGFSGVSTFGGQVNQHPHEIGDGRHETKRNHALLAPWLGDFDPVCHRPKLHVAPQHVAAADSLPSGATVLAPSSVWATKRWPEAHWAALVDLLHAHGEPVVLLGAAPDRPLLERIAFGAKEAPRLVAGDLNLLGSAALMAKSKAVVSNDSAPLHMAGAVGTPVVGVFCSTTPRLGFGVLPEDEASGRGQNVEVKEEELACKPCGVHGKTTCPLGHFQCGEDLAVKAVWASLQAVSSPRV